MTHIQQRIADITSTLPQGVTLVAVSKFHPARAIREAYDAGQRVFGESRAAELTAKAAELPTDIEWHFIGHLQTNKVRPVVATARLIHSVDSERLLRAIDAESRRIGHVTDILLQVHVAMEETKFGFLPDELIELADSGLFDRLNGVRLRGVMGMASNVDDTNRIDSDFAAIAETFRRLKATAAGTTSHCDTISMGMSDDYHLAVAHGSTMVRVGSTIFGQRE